MLRFQSTFPLQGTTNTELVYGSLDVFQSTFPLQGTTIVTLVVLLRLKQISIHVPIAGNDDFASRNTNPNRHFNPRSHCRERQSYIHIALGQEPFQSTFPLQGTTKGDRKGYTTKKDFNPRSHCRERRVHVSNADVAVYISIHVPIAGNDSKILKCAIPIFTFQSTFPLQGTTYGVRPFFIVESYFNPRSHCRERLPYFCLISSDVSFQSTFPLQGTTISLLVYIKDAIFQSTFPLQGTTAARRPFSSNNFAFQSTFPLQGTTC